VAGLARLVRRSEAPDFAERLARNYRDLELSPRLRSLLDYAHKLSQTPPRMSEADLQPLRNAGLSDRDILDANLVVAYFAYVNRIAEGLGVTLEPGRQPPSSSEEVSG
jgi:uncharacterized peroxidase-related enzyme